MTMASGPDLSRFSSRAEASRALHELIGLLQGLGLDGAIVPGERLELERWLARQGHLIRFPAFQDIFQAAQGTLDNEELTVAEVGDLISSCRKFEALFDYYDDVTAALQVLEGLLHGIISDGELQGDELHGLLRWTEQHRVLAGIFPFDEVHGQVQRVCTEGVAGKEERLKLVRMIYDLVDIVDPVVRETIGREVRDVPDQILYDPSAELVVPGHSFCFSGRSATADREEIASRITAAGGRYVTGVSGRTDYLVLGALGNPFWAHSRYGRKVEKAIALRREGYPIRIIREEDLWKALGT